MPPVDPRQTAAASTPAAADQRFVWTSRFGTIVVEVIGDVPFVNGRPVEPAAET